MARSPEGAALTEAHRRLQSAIAAASVRDLLRLWGLLNPDDVRGTLNPVLVAGVNAVARNRRHSSTAAARYYVAFRQVEGVRGTVVVTSAAEVPGDVVAGSLRGAALAGTMNGRRRGMNQEEALKNGFVKMAGSATSLVMGGGRQTLMDAIHGDREAIGWQRVTDGSPCAFCAMIASRGIVFKSDASADFQAHGHCTCTAEPAYEGSKVNASNARFREAWDGATEGLGGAEALAAFRQSLAS